MHLNFYPTLRDDPPHYLLKDGLSLNIKKLHIHLYFIATKYLLNYSLVEYRDNCKRYYSLVKII